jgi:hypothetical protein
VEQPEGVGVEQEEKGYPTKVLEDTKGPKSTGGWRRPTRGLQQQRGWQPQEPSGGADHRGVLDHKRRVETESCHGKHGGSPMLGVVRPGERA